MNPLIAQAAPNTNIKVAGELKMLPEGTPGPATVGDRMSFEGTWDASDASPQPGDTFSIKLPDVFKFDGDKALELKGDGGVVWGN